MKTFIIILLIVVGFLFGFTFLPTCASQPAKVLYEGTLTNVSTKSGVTTITFAINTAVTSNYNSNFGEGVLIYGETYDLMQKITGGETVIYLVKVK